MKKILVIEDEEDILENLCELLDTEGYLVEGASNGKQGVEYALRHTPDLIISDLMMPEMDGHDVLRIVRSNPETRLVPFIFLTARADKMDIREGMNLGADDYLTKPFNLDELLEAVASKFDKAAMLRQAIDDQMNDLRRNITTAIPHELRTPLAAIIGFTEILVDDWKTMEMHDVHSMLSEILKASHRIKTLTERFTEVAELETLLNHQRQLQEYRTRRCDGASAVINQIAKTVADKYERPVDLHVQLADASLHMDSGHFRRLVNELVENAFKFSPPGSPVSIQTELIDNDFVLKVIDEGRGMNDEQLEAVGAFVQFDRDTLEQQGSGLGLCMAKQVTTIYQGELEIESVVNETTRVTVRLPLAIQSEPVLI